MNTSLYEGSLKTSWPDIEMATGVSIAYDFLQVQHFSGLTIKFHIDVVSSLIVVLNKKDLMFLEKSISMFK